MEAFLIDMVKQGGPQVFAVLIAMYYISKILDRNKEDIEKNTEAVAENTEETRDLRHAVLKLELQFEQFNKVIPTVDRTAKGMTILFDQVKALKERLDG